MAEFVCNMADAGDGIPRADSIEFCDFIEKAFEAFTVLLQLLPIALDWISCRLLSHRFVDRCVAVAALIVV